MADSELCYLPATEALRFFRERKLSPVELLEAVIARAERVEPKINAFTFRFFERAREQARRAEARYLRGGRVRPLEGVPVVIKDETAIKGERTTMGSLIYKENVDDHTAPAAERILGAGAILIARSTAPEFSCAPFTHSRLWGVTRTPWNLEYSCGGSSGGSAASLAAGSTTLANGSDIGGSIRIPASACGVVGYKPPYGRNPDSSPFNLDWYNHAGPLSRTVADAALLQNVLAGPHPSDIATVRPRLRIPSELAPVRGLRVAFSINLGYFQVDPEVERNTRAATEVFRGLGCEVEEVAIGWTESVRTAGWHHLSALFGAWVGKLLPAHRDEMTAYALEFARRAEKTTLADLLEAMEVEGQMYEQLSAVFRRFDLLVCPTLAVPSVKAEHDVTDREFSINGVKVDPYLDWCMTYPFNMMSRCPVMSVPSGFASNGVPTGIQIVGKTFDDVTVFRAAADLERARPWLDAPTRRPKL